MSDLGTRGGAPTETVLAIGKDEKVTADVCTWPGSVDDRVQKVLLRRARELSKLF